VKLGIFNVLRLFSDRMLTIHNISRHSSNVLPLNNIVGRVGDAWYIWKVGRGTLRQWGVTALHQEITIIDYACATGGCREQSSPGSRTVICGQLRLIRKRHPANWNDFVARLLDGRVPRGRHGDVGTAEWTDGVQVLGDSVREVRTRS